MIKDKIILTGKHGRPSTKLAFSSGLVDNDSTLVQKRKLKSGKSYFRMFTDKKTLYKKVTEEIPYLYENRTLNKKGVNEFNAEESVVVRWGTTQQMLTNNKTVVYNSCTAIKNATDKKLSRELFIEENVSCPKLVTKTNVVTNDLPIIARPFIHSKGKNFIVLNTIAEFNNHFNPQTFYYSNFIDKDREFRVHVGHSKALAILEKIKPQDGGIAWNRAQNDVDPFEYINWGEVDTQKLHCVLLEAIKAVKAVGLDMGGVDVMLKDGVAYVLEVNTAPTLNTSPYVAKRWCMYWDWLFASETRKEHWDYTKFKKGSSLIWKNYQLKKENENEE